MRTCGGKCYAETAGGVKIAALCLLEVHHKQRRSQCGDDSDENLQLKRVLHITLTSALSVKRRGHWRQATTDPATYQTLRMQENRRGALTEIIHCRVHLTSLRKRKSGTLPTSHFAAGGPDSATSKRPYWNHQLSTYLFFMRHSGAG